MAPTLCFSRNRCTSVEQIDDQTMRSTCRLQDTLTEAWIEITVRLPDLEIIAARGEFRRAVNMDDTKSDIALKKVIGVRIGSGMLKIIEGLIGEVTDCKELAFMVEECCHGIILAFTKDTLQTIPETEDAKKDYFAKMVKDNIRLYNRCAAFRPGSSIVEGIDPP
jgi:hypothetical protein